MDRPPRVVRIDPANPIAKGRMRECFRLKKVLEPPRPEPGEAPRERAQRRVDHHADKIYAWHADCSSEVSEFVPHLGRRTLLRVRHRLGLPGLSIHNATIFTVGELAERVQALGARKVEIEFGENCPGLGASELKALRTLIARAIDVTTSWQRPSINYMAKRYMKQEDDTPEVYRGDVVMQEVCKRLALQFNSWSPPPPKMIDMLHVGLVRLTGRPDQPFFGYESFVTGEYRKWNTNGGWRDESNFRHTPHAFSFATFRMTKGALMVVDVQGVGDLYTDPQVHSCSGQGFGEGNLGARGMALFLHSFRYDLNPIVQYMDFEPFLLMPGEQPSASEAEAAKFEAGEAYLKSQTWFRRSRSIGSGDGLDIEDELDAVTWESKPFLGQRAPPASQVNAFPAFLSRCVDSLEVGELPRDLRSSVPDIETSEATVHMALAQLYDERDERILAGTTVDPEATSRFHTWLAALGGCLPAMLACAKDDAATRPSRLQWAHNAAKRGSREASVLALSLIEPGDTMLELFYVQRAIECDDGRTERQRKSDMDTCQHELHARLAAANLALGDRATAVQNLERAAALAMEAGEFRLHERYSEEAAQLGSDDQSSEEDAN